MDELLEKQLEAALRRLYVSKEAEGSRFGLVPVGEAIVKLMNVKPFLASWNCKLDDNLQLCNKEKKANFPDARFDQPVFILVFQNEIGNVIMTRRHVFGWLTDTEVDKKTKKLIATPDYIREHKLKAVPAKFGYRFVDENNKAFLSPQKTKVSTDYNDKFCEAVGLPAGSSILDAAIGTTLKIKVEQREYTDPDTGVIEMKSEVADFVSITGQFKVREVTAKEEVVAVPAPPELSWT